MLWLFHSFLLKCRWFHKNFLFGARTRAWGPRACGLPKVNVADSIRTSFWSIKIVYILWYILMFWCIFWCIFWYILLVYKVFLFAYILVNVLVYFHIFWYILYTLVYQNVADSTRTSSLGPGPGPGDLAPAGCLRYMLVRVGPRKAWIRKYGINLMKYNYPSVTLTSWW